MTVEFDHNYPNRGWKTWLPKLIAKTQLRDKLSITMPEESDYGIEWYRLKELVKRVAMEKGWAWSGPEKSQRVIRGEGVQYLTWTTKPPVTA